ncbi:M16 family metallopeptidase [Aquisalibacillus elongatus]|uniref:Putative Zn-dependent peptidase n=1 Tax=Aquisalibacillus elongatus TaxID=485577 RepID=A0A3N5BE09_9BACI|nr:pitrilysin family protein [Aquisalibacillus elongatus]RPF55946.1 putative Zn-dependent peptidase [Aquisalibacillus elongatus]
MIRRYQLDNGLRIVEESLPSLRSVSIGIWILTGSRNESYAYNGISHLIEHMLFKGTQTRNARDIAEAFDSIGGDTNAFTSKEYTCLYAKVMDQHTNYALDLMFDMIFNSTFDEDELEREKNVIYEEIAMTEDTPDDIIHDHLHEVSFKYHPLGKPILGNHDTLEGITRDDILKFREEYYTSDRIVISIAGNIPEGLYEKINELFSDLPSNSSSNDELMTSYNIEVMKQHKETTQAHLCLGYEGIPIHHDSIYHMAVLNNVLGGSMSSRLFQKIREELGLTYTIFSYHNAFRDNGILTVYGATNLEQLDLLEQEIQLTVEDIWKHGITEKELNNTIQQLKGQIVLGLENPNSRMHRNGRNELLGIEHIPLNSLIQQFEQVTHRGIEELAQKTFSQKPSKACILPQDV